MCISWKLKCWSGRIIWTAREESALSWRAVRYQPNGRRIFQEKDADGPTKNVSRYRRKGKSVLDSKWGSGSTGWILLMHGETMRILPLWLVHPHVFTYTCNYRPFSDTKISLVVSSVAKPPSGPKQRIYISQIYEIRFGVELDFSFVIKSWQPQRRNHRSSRGVLPGLCVSNCV